jgi:hypothetical protein
MELRALRVSSSNIWAFFIKLLTMALDDDQPMSAIGNGMEEGYPNDQTFNLVGGEEGIYELKLRHQV